MNTSMMLSKIIVTTIRLFVDELHWKLLCTRIRRIESFTARAAPAAL